MSEGPQRRRFRFSLRTLFVVVTLAGLWLAHVMRARQLAAVHAAVGNNYGVVAAAAQDNRPWINFEIDSFPSQRNKKLQAQYTALFFYHQEMSEKYRRAVWRPWVLLQSDPPPPESN